MVDDHSCRGVALVCVGYMFLTHKNVHPRCNWKKWDERDIGSKLVLKVLVARDMRSKAVFARAASAKGGGLRRAALLCSPWWRVSRGSEIPGSCKDR